ncbi:MAG TPA: hypothetical protein VHZ52_13645 [Acidobacteriaceae bacterium]|jgi:hypothetical protein|nr:hypothetical protein [Acidobacteriaceae bacterium]
MRKDYNGGMSGKWSHSRRILVFSFLMASVGIAAVAQDSSAPKRGRKYKAPPVTSRVEVTVTRATNGRPVENAAVIFHPLVDGHNDGNMELKTNDEGKTVIDLLETGSNVRLQVIADGFQTYGEDYKVDKDTMAIEVKLKRPAEQYSIYKKNEGAKKSGAATSDAGDKTPKADAPADTPKDAPSETKPDAPKDAPKDEAKPKDPQSSAPQFR